MANLELRLQTFLYNYAVGFSSQQAADPAPAIPLLVELLADAAFHPLHEWLHEREVNLAELQVAINQYLERARILAQAAAARE